MRFELSIDGNELENLIEQEFNRVKVPIQAAMANRCASIIHNNFGTSGEDRPTEWPILSANYAKEFHDGNRIPTLQLKGDLQSSVEIDENSFDAASVFTNNKYALQHQNGDDSKNLPARPFFPIINGELTDYTAAECVDAAKRELEKQL